MFIYHPQIIGGYAVGLSTAYPDGDKSAWHFTPQ